MNDVIPNTGLGKFMEDEVMVDLTNFTPIEVMKPPTVTHSGIYVNKDEQQWEIWYVSEDNMETVDDLMVNSCSEDIKPKLLGFSSFRLGYQIKEIWKHEFFQRWSGMRNDHDGWEC